VRATATQQLLRQKSALGNADGAYAFRRDFQSARSEGLYERPIAERHRLVFYLGHLETFDWNLICAGGFGMKSLNPQFDRLFAFGIDPTNGNLPGDTARDWPREAEIRNYNERVRTALDTCIEQSADDLLFRVAIEHRLMHVETLAYLLHGLPYSMKKSPLVTEASVTPPVMPCQVPVSGGMATLGLERASGEFGWDNEFDVHQVNVPAFAIDVYKVTNGQYLEFVRAGGYNERSLWSTPSWEWITASGVQYPKFWKPVAGGWQCRTMFADIEFQPSWPVYVSHAKPKRTVDGKGKPCLRKCSTTARHSELRMAPNGCFPGEIRRPRLSTGISIFRGGIPLPSIRIRQVKARLGSKV
jgi:Uncharacterized conserved protein